MSIKKDYIKTMTKTLMHMNPGVSKDIIEELVIRKMKERLIDPVITMDNNVTGENQTIHLTDLCNWIEKRNPVISGNATFYVQPEEHESPVSKMLRTLKKERKRKKGEMYKFKPEDDEYQLLDLQQGNDKVVMNAEYGGSGAPTAAFYNKYSPAATTLMAQSIITTMAAFFEGYVGDNQKFYSISECMDWLNIIRNKKKEIPKWIKRPITSYVVNRIKSKFITYSEDYTPILECYISNCTTEEQMYIYYANNLKELIVQHTRLQTLIKNILTTLPLYEATEKDIPAQFQDKFTDKKKYNSWVSKEMFLNPYHVPDCIKKDLSEFTTIMNQMIFVEYITPDSIMKLNNHQRNTILLVDTDSNVINSDIFVELVLTDLFPGESFGRDKLYNEMIVVNILANTLDYSVIDLLDFYGRCRNMNPEARAELVMKNEYMFRRLFLMNKKKRYASSVVLREGDIMIPFRTEIKGVDFIKAGVSDEVTDYFTKMLKEHILDSDELELHNLMRDLKRLERIIYDDLKQGGTRFLKMQTYKSQSAYANPWQIPVFRAVNAWNYFTDTHKVSAMDRVRILKLTVTGPGNLDKLKELGHTDQWNAAMDNIYKSGNENVIKAGLKVIAIPSNVPKIPDWLIPLIDYDVIISDVIASFRSILNALDLEEMSLKTPNGKAQVISSLISI